MILSLEENSDVDSAILEETIFYGMIITDLFIDIVTEYFLRISIIYLNHLGEYSILTYVLATLSCFQSIRLYNTI